MNGMPALVIETYGLHIGFLGCYGNEWIATPNLDRLATDGIVFERHIHHEPGRSSCFNLGDGIVRVTATTLADWAANVSRAWQSCDGRLLWVDGPMLGPPWDLPADLRTVYDDDDDDADAAQAQDVHVPLGVVGKLPLRAVTALQNRYAAAVTWFDAQLGELLTTLAGAATWDDTIVVVTARAGLPLGEHGLVGYERAWLHEEFVHVPLLMRLPQRQARGWRLDVLTQPVDLEATLAKLLGNGAGPSGGHDLTLLLTGAGAAVRSHAFSRLQIGDSAEAALRSDEWAYLLPLKVPAGDPPRPPQLYAKPADRWEVNDVRQHHLELAERLEQELARAVGL
ncbi:MAG: sulfatase-like hydrolase/transferase [Gemmataceae bacterium]|nr:sulfatase-like hydrolase/transferase [Gemmataceae bacterium]